MANKRTVILRGVPIQNEDGKATAVIRPGYLVDGVSTVAPHGTAGGACPMTIALERDEMGAGIDSTYTEPSTISPNYAINDYVKIGGFSKGMRFVGWIASGQNITENDRMESAGDGTFRKLAAGVILARSLETTGAVTVLTKIQLEVM